MEAEYSGIELHDPRHTNLPVSSRERNRRHRKKPRTNEEEGRYGPVSLSCERGLYLEKIRAGVHLTDGMKRKEGVPDRRIL